MIKIEIIEDTTDTCGFHIIAKKGRIGYINTGDYNYFGIGKRKKRPHYIRTKLEGNKIFREIPNWKMRVIK